MSLIPFDFDGTSIRVVLDDSGEPWFVAKDVCDALGQGTDATRRVDEDERGLRSVQTPSGSQSMTVLSESGLYSLILTSRVDAASRFKRWVTKEVLPSIRKTGSYAKAAPVAALPAQSERVQFLNEARSMLVEIGTEPGIAAAAWIRSAERATGLDLSDFKQALPATTQPSERLNPTQIAEALGLGKKPRLANQLLVSAGLQTQEGRDGWMLTELGRQHGESLPYVGGKSAHAGNMLRWRKSVLEVLGEVSK